MRLYHVRSMLHRLYCLTITHRQVPSSASFSCRGFASAVATQFLVLGLYLFDQNSHTIVRWSIVIIRSIEPDIVRLVGECDMAIGHSLAESVTSHA